MRFVNGTRAEDLAGTGIFTKQRAVVPFWVSATGSMFSKTLRVVGRLIVSAWRHPLLTSLSVVLAVVAVEYGKRGALGVLAITALGLVGWLWRWPASFQQKVADPGRGLFRWAVFYAWRYSPAIHGAKLSRADSRRVLRVPKITRITSTGVVDTLHIRLMHGQTPEDFFDQAEGLRHAFNAFRLAVIEDAPGRIRLRVFARDPLADVVPAIPAESVPESPDLAALRVGLSEAGIFYLLCVFGSHVLIAGATGSGKGSVIWSILRILCPGITAGLVRVTGIDPKGGMELFPGRALFAYYADESAEQMVAALEAAVVRMTARRFRLRGSQRDFTATLAEPFEVILIDELAWLTAYHPDRKIRDRVKAALSLLLSQGRAVGFCVVACLQDPRKDVLSFRDLFPTRIALRTTEDSHVDMILGDGALKRGAECHRIPASLPGVGFVHVDGAREPVRVRFTWITDDHIADMADRWPAPAIETTAQVIDLTSRDRAATADQQPPSGGPENGASAEPYGA